MYGKNKTFINSSKRIIEPLEDKDSAIVFKNNGTIISILPLENSDEEQIMSEAQTMVAAILYAIQNDELMSNIYKNLLTMNESNAEILQKLQKNNKFKLN